MKHKYELILFDLDGTIADTDEMIVQTMNTLYDKYRNGHRTPREEVYYFSGPPITETLAKEFPNYDFDFMFSEFVKYSSENYPKYVTLYPRTKETLLKLKENGYKLGIITNKMHNPTLLCLKLLGLENIFDVLVCFDDVKHPKPERESIDIAMKKMSVSDFTKVLYIGDNKIDLDTANTAGVDGVLVSWGPRKLDPNLKPTFFISSYEELERRLLDE